MKNETARREIESLDYYLQNHTDDYSEESHTAMMMGIKALGQEPCEDTISRQAVLDLINADWKYEGLEEPISSLPPVSPQSKIAHWISHYDEDAKEGWYECDRCHTERAFNTDFCPDCGAKMVEPQESTGMTGSGKMRKGHWIIIDDCEKFIAKCSECGRIEDSRMISKYPYCHCGARMVEPQESEEV